MNLFNNYLKLIKKSIIKHNKIIGFNSKTELDKIIIESPPDKFDYDLSSNIALVLSKKINQNPRIIADKIKNILQKEIKDFSDIYIAGPGFLNFNLSHKAWINIINMILKSGKKFGINKSKNKINIEFVSANPTGPMHIGHCRGAVFGDVLSNLLKFNGNKITKEFYINDYGNQVDDFSKSVFYRLREIKFDEEFPKDQSLYPGNYIIDISRKILKKNPKIDLKSFDKIKNKLKKISIQYSMDMIKTDLKNLNIKHDHFFSETKLVKDKSVQKAIDLLKKNNFVQEGFLEPPKGEENINWKKTKRLIFKSSLFNDDTNRALKKDDNSWTYFANDVGYHHTKILRRYDYLVNILGADHTGYIKRISAAVNALSKNKIKLICKVCQLVKFIKNGQPFKMSKREGDFITIKDVLNEVGKDSVRFMMLNRGNEVEIDFDFDKVLEKSKDNPVFYVQYSYARINSLFRSLNLNLNNNINLKNKDYLPNPYEIKLLRKIIEWPKIIELASNKLEPHRIPFYLYEISTIFHSYWSRGNENPKYKFIVNGKINNPLSLKIFQLIAIILQNGMSILGVSLPKKM
ncbi:MAG: arginine--tRNA ligase [Candidatus Pelagibacter sp.]|nr:arginine--tRNA ligase [Candidatus Pelagibacter sp.]|tara:strand:+ start:3282 stop:5006 length:1725 start_codon:yes stop_codon:yes gene_type:complete